jgi:uncharacterized phage protein (TIGR01671 family)
MKMREILFKAKRITTGEWVEGYYQKRYDEIERELHYIFWCESNIVWEYAEIDINTLCQYTGLTDNNGNKIWENDVVKQEYEDWRTKFDYCVIENIKYVEEEARFVTYDKKENKSYFLSKHSVYEVIGNIFDNPELLGGGE